MKNIISAAIISAVAFGAAAASADVTKMGNVFRDGVSIGSIYDVKVAGGTSPSVAAAEVEAMYADLELQAKKDKAQDKRKARKAAIAGLETKIAAKVSKIAELEANNAPAEDIQQRVDTIARFETEIAAIELQNERATRY